MILTGRIELLSALKGEKYKKIRVSSPEAKMEGQWPGDTSGKIRASSEERRGGGTKVRGQPAWY